jgi:hypothetical protein
MPQTQRQLLVAWQRGWVGVCPHPCTCAPAGGWSSSSNSWHSHAGCVLYQECAAVDRFMCALRQAQW